MRQRVSTGTPFETIAGYSRAVRVGDVIHVAGTTATDALGNVLAVGDPAKQASVALDRIEAALVEAGAGMEHVVRTRIYVVDVSHVEEVMRAHGEVFSDIRPAATLVVVQALVAPEMLVEIEAEAIL